MQPCLFLFVYKDERGAFVMKVWKKWRNLILVLAVLAGGTGALMWYLHRPVVLDPAQLTAADTLSAYPGTELSLEIAHGTIRGAVFRNESTRTVYHGDPPDYSGLEVCLEGIWYHVPHQEYATSGVGEKTGPGECFAFEPILSPYGTLPDGQYRLSFGYWPYDGGEDMPLRQQTLFVCYARFDSQKGQCVFPNGS